MNVCDNCGHCTQCRKKKCGAPCGHAEPVFSVEAMPDDPDILRFNVNGKSVWYDFSSVVKHAETATTIMVDEEERALNHYGEKSDQSISASELGSILHLADIGDVNAETIDDNGILNYRKDADCGEGCDGINNGWVSTNPVEAGENSLDYILGSDADGKLVSLIPPADTASFSYLAWAAQDKAIWTKPTEFATCPTDSDGYKYVVCIDPSTGAIGFVKEKVQ